jgi:hypothetical protein
MAHRDILRCRTNSAASLIGRLGQALSGYRLLEMQAAT